MHARAPGVLLSRGACLSGGRDERGGGGGQGSLQLAAKRQVPARAQAAMFRFVFMIFGSGVEKGIIACCRHGTRIACYPQR